MASLDKVLNSAITTYQELNSGSISEFTELPSPLEFMTFVAKNKPFIIRKGASRWPAVSLWNAGYLKHAMGESRIKVAVTPFGNADSVIHDGESLKFVKPLEVEQRFDAFIDGVVAQESTPGDRLGPVQYAQSQNDNLRDEYLPLYKDVEPDIPWARVALGRKPDAINFWLGNSRSVTSLHRDNYENIYVQAVGFKYVVLLPPSEMPCVNEQELLAATYTADNQGEFHATRDSPEATIPYATWDPDKPENRQSRFSRLGRPYRATLGPGDMMYLPALWYHKISQGCENHGFSCSVNYWYDMDFEGPLWASSSLIREAFLLSKSMVT